MCNSFKLEFHLQSWDQAVQNFQLKLLRLEIFTAAKTHHICYQKPAASRKVFLKSLDNHILPSVILSLRNRVRNHIVSSEHTLQEKFNKLMERQYKPPRSSNEKTVVVLEQILPIDVKILYINVPLKEAINIAPRLIYARDVNQKYLEQQ